MRFLLGILCIAKVTDMRIPLFAAAAVYIRECRIFTPPGLSEDEEEGEERDLHFGYCFTPWLGSGSSGVLRVPIPDSLDGEFSPLACAFHVLDFECAAL